MGLFFVSSHLIAGDLNCCNKLATLCFTGTGVLESSSDGPGTFDQVPHWTRQQIFFTKLAF